MYQNKPYQVRPIEDVLAEIRAAGISAPETRRVFLADGDALAAPFEVQAKVLEEIKRSMPSVQRVGVYGDSRAILKLGEEQLGVLRELGLGIIYFGPESGDEVTLREVKKGATVARQLEASHLVNRSGTKLSMMVLLGLAGVAGSRRHARATGRFIAAAGPTYAAALTVTPVAGTAMHAAWKSGDFRLPDRWGMLEELLWMLEEMEGYRGQFHANHASNYLPLKLRMPKDRLPAIGLIREVLESRDENRLRPEWSRGL
jgi:radical SAM superfamily enzyme YgiQ (UPF0313 family)